MAKFTKYTASNDMIIFVILLWITKILFEQL